MAMFAVVKTGGKQYLVKEKSELVVDLLPDKEKSSVELDTLAVFDDGEKIEIGTPNAKLKVKAEVVSHLKGDKIRVAKFKAKARYRKVKGFRPQLTKLKIVKI